MTGDGTLWTEGNLIAGDVVILDADGTPEEAIISTIASDTSIVLTAAPSGTYNAGSDYQIRRRFNANYPQKLQYEVVDGLVIFTDYSRTPLAWNGTTLTPFFTTTPYLISSICYWKERLWALKIFDFEGEGGRWREKSKSQMDYSDR